MKRGTLAEIEDSYLDELNSAEKPETEPCPVPEYIDLRQLEMVADIERCSLSEAERLPQWRFDFLLRVATARAESAPAVEEAQRERAERRTEEDKARREAMDY